MRFLRFLLVGLLFLALQSFIVPSAFAAGPDCNDKAVVDAYTPETICTEQGMSEDSCRMIQCLIDKSESQPGTGMWYAPSFKEFSQKVFDSPGDEIFGERYTFAQVNWIFQSMLAMVMPRANSLSDLVNTFKIYNEVFEQISQNGITPSIAKLTPLGPLAVLGGLGNQLYANPIASGLSETKKLAQVFQVVPEANAQGFGYNQLASGNAVILWQATRNMAYLIAVVLLAAAGFMVMFRTKVNPQAIVTVQMMLPKLVITLVLITFSFAIVGFIIDMVYVAIAAFVGLLSLGSGGSILAGGNVGQVITALSTAGIGAFANWFLMTMIIVSAIMAIVFWFIAGSANGPLLLPIMLFIFGLFAWSIWIVVRIMAQLIFAYVNLFLLTIAGPLEIMLDLIPNQNQLGFKRWIRCVIANASVFAVYAIVSVMLIVLFDQGGPVPLMAPSSPRALFATAGSGGLLTMQDAFNLPFFNLGAGETDNQIMAWIVQLLIILGILNAVPSIVNGIRNSLCKSTDQSGVAEGYAKNFVKTIEGSIAARAKARARKDAEAG